MQSDGREAYRVDTGVCAFDLKWNQFSWLVLLTGRHSNCARRSHLEYLFTHGGVRVLRQDQVECVAQAVHQENLVCDGHDDEERVVEGPLDVSYVFSDRTALCHRLEFLNVIWIILLLVLLNFVVLVLQLSQRGQRHMRVMALLRVEGEWVLVRFDQIYIGFLLLVQSLLPLQELGSHLLE